MKTVRLLPLLALVTLVVAMTTWWDGAPAEVDDGLGAPLIPAAAGAEALSSTWFCAAGSAGTPRPPAHGLILTNPSDHALSARLTAYGAEGAQGSEVVEVGASTTARVNVRDTFGAHDLSVMVESASGELAVEHRLTSATAVDQVPCATSSSDRWYFPVQNTALEARGEDEEAPTDPVANSARLVLFNPFSSDASVEITAAVDDGLRAPAEWAGLVVPAGTTRTVDLGEFVQRREQFSLSVELRNGRVIAETAQTHVQGNQVRGVRLQLGVPDSAPRWGFAAGFTGPGTNERLVVYNPGADLARVIVQVTPVGGAAMPPEPFELDVASRRYRVIELSDEGRVPGVGQHSIQVESDTDTPIVVGRVTTVTGPPESADEGAGADPEVVPRPDLEHGTTIGTGSTLLATRWLVPLVITGGDQQPALIVNNPGAEPVIVSAATLAGDGEAVSVMDDVQVPAGDGVVVPLAGLEGLPEGDVAIQLTAGSPVLVERLVTFAEQGDLSLGLAIPYPPRGGGRFPLISEL